MGKKENADKGLHSLCFRNLLCDVPTRPGADKKVHKILLVVLASLLFSPHGGAKDDVRHGIDKHVIDKQDWQRQPTVPDAMNDRIIDAAKTYAAQGTVARIAFFDLAAPASDSELAAMKGYGVLLVTAVSQDRDELPPKRLVGVAGKVESPLVLIAGSTVVDDRDQSVAKVLGRNRWYGLYLFPVCLMHDGNYLAIDFAAHRKDFVLSRYSNADLAELGYGNPVTALPADVPDHGVVMKLVAREFPGFLSRQ